MGDTHSHTFRCRFNPLRHTVYHHFRRDQNTPGTTRRRNPNVDDPAVYVPGSLPVLSAHEFPHSEAAHAMEVNELDQLKDRLAQVQKSLDVDTLVHIQKTTLQQEAQPHWHLIIATVSCTLTILLVTGILRSKLRCATSCRSRTVESTENGTSQSSTHPVPVFENTTVTVYSEPQFENATFATYALARKD
jgi:hypothetical protein